MVSRQRFTIKAPIFSHSFFFFPAMAIVIGRTSPGRLIKRVIAPDCRFDGDVTN